MNRKVIRVFGADYSGTTMLDMIIANDPKGFSCGELYALFRPFRRHHDPSGCSCAERDCTIWHRGREVGERGVVPHLLNVMEGVEFIVDSSKDLVWAIDQTRYMKARDDIEFIDLLIWKHPLNFGYSCWKRSEEASWEKRWLNYHRRLLECRGNIVNVRCEKLVESPEKYTRLICGELGIAYFGGKERYWEKQHHTLFGSQTARQHLYSKQSVAYKEIVGDRIRKRGNYKAGRLQEGYGHRRIASSEEVAEEIMQVLEKSMKRRNEMERIVATLGTHEIDAEEREPEVREDSIIRGRLRAWYWKGKVKAAARKAMLKQCGNKSGNGG